MCSAPCVCASTALGVRTPVCAPRRGMHSPRKCTPLSVCFVMLRGVFLNATSSCTSELDAPVADMRTSWDGMHMSRGCTLFNTCFEAQGRAPWCAPLIALLDCTCLGA